MAHQPVSTLEELDALDEDLMVAGYRAGFANDPDYTQKDKAYWHGFMNGQVDKGFIRSSPEQHALAHAIVERSRAEPKAEQA